MILYMDTSALIKRYIGETGSHQVIELWQKAEGLAVSKVAYAEMMAVFYRKKQLKEMVAKVLNVQIKAFKEDWKSFIRVDVSLELEEIIEKVVSRNILRGFDALHLASALFLKQSFKEDFLFVCADKRLVEVASSEHLQVCPIAL